MNSILSIFETAVADYLLLASVTAAVLVAGAWGFVRLGKVRSSVNRHMVWLFTLLAIVLLPGMWLYGPKLTLAVLPGQSSSMETSSQPVDYDFTVGPVEEIAVAPSAPVRSEGVSQNADTHMPFKFPPLLRLIILGWGIGFFLMLARLAAGWIRLGHMARKAEFVSDTEGFENSAGKKIKLLISPKVDSPVCFGLLRPVILIPKRMYDETSQEDLGMILRHELAHIERRDCWVNLFQRIVEAALFFHPLVWYASFQLTQQREQLCDQHVIAGGASAENYVQLLARIARQGFEKRTLQAVALFEGRLLSRVQSLLGLGGRIQIKASRRAIGALAVAAMLCLAVGAVRLEAQSGETEALDIPGDTQVAASFRPQEETLGPSGNRPVGNCSLSGRVVSAETGGPVENATVYLFYVGTHDPIFIKVASDGSFFFEDIPSGEYAMRTTRIKGFQDAVYDPGDNVMGMVGFFSLVEGEERSGIVFELEPAYSISGRILGEGGEPLTGDGDGIGVVVWKAREETSEGPARYEIEKQAQLDPDGFYSLDGLSGSPVLVMTIDWQSFEKNDAMPPCYYPGTVSRDEATLIKFSAESSVENIDIQLVRKGSAVLEGTVSDEATGAPVANALVTVHHTDMLFDYISAYTDEAGYYRIDSLGSGEFLVHIDPKPWGYVRTRQPVALNAGQSTRLDFTLKPAAAISGTFVDEDGELIEIYENAYGSAYTIDPASSDESEEADGWSWTSTGYRNKYSEKGIRERQSGISFSGGQGCYNNSKMVFLTANSFLIEAILPGETHLSFYPKEQGVEVKKILYNGEDILTAIELPEGEMDYATVDAVLQTSPGDTVEGVIIVLGPVADSPTP